MKKAVLEAIERFSLLEGAGEVTVALSGGADSMALLHLLLHLREALSIKVNAAHLNHLIRGEEAFRDEEFVRKQCEEWGVELFCERADIPRLSKEMGISTELCARKVRYEFLEGVAKGVIATAHTASDNLETVLFNLSRGTAASGLCGIPAKRGRIIRPLLLCTRAEVEQYCEKQGIDFVTDSTNLTNAYTRNKIRHNAVPVLKEINPALETAVLRMCESIRQDSDFIDGIAKAYIKENAKGNTLKLEGFSALDIAVAKRVVRIFADSVDGEIDPEAVHINELIRVIREGVRTSLPKDYYAEIQGDLLYILKKGEKIKNNTCFSVEFEEKSAEFLKITKKINNLLLNNCIDCDKIVGELVVRVRESGDKIRLRNRGCTKSLKDLYSENKIDLPLRDIIPVVADDNGVLWIWGIGVAQRCAVTEKTKRVLIINAEKKAEFNI